ncbi:MAG: hypothetical protein FJ144_18550 [Deltaproteobacteria bacterium]|nr:hypothetical protein [Deltaproteobacteria bacterium]
MKRRLSDRWVAVVALGVILLGLAISIRGLERLNTWYLASDQYAFLTLAHALRDGGISHHDFVYDVIPKAGTRDALAQTYLLRDGELISRYPPGFPALLAVAGAIAGDRGEHALNPLLYLVVFVLLAWLVHVLLRPTGRGFAAACAAAAVWLLLLLPTDVHLWGITVARDLPAHLLGFLAVLAAASGRFGWAGLAMGFACVIRPDALLYGSSLAAVALVRRERLRDLAFAVPTFLLGVAPLLAYNQATLGHPLSFTQGSEFGLLWSALGPSSAYASSVVPAGGGFRFSHLAGTLPGNLALLEASFGWLILAAVLGLGWAIRRRGLLAAAFAPYAITATIFYSCWSHPDARYLAGVSLCLIPLAAVGCVVLCRNAAARESHVLWKVAVFVALALALLCVAGLLPSLPAPGMPATVVLVVAAAVAALSLSPALAERLAGVAVIAPAVALAALGLFEVASGSGSRDPYQEYQIVRARHRIESLLPPGSIVITSPSLGRPGENLSHYTHARALYDSELDLLGVGPGRLATFHKRRGRHVFYLLPEGDLAPLTRLRQGLVAKRVRDIEPGEAMDWFLNPRLARAGAVLYEIEFTPELAPLVDSLPPPEGRPPE